MIIVVNAEKVVMSGKKEEQKVYKRHVNGLPGSMKEESFKALQACPPPPARALPSLTLPFSLSLELQGGGQALPTEKEGREGLVVAGRHSLEQEKIANRPAKRKCCLQTCALWQTQMKICPLVRVAVCSLTPCRRETQFVRGTPCRTAAASRALSFLSGRGCPRGGRAATCLPRPVAIGRGATRGRVQKRLPERIIEKAVWGMLPKGRLGRKIKHNMWVRPVATLPKASQPGRQPVPSCRESRATGEDLLAVSECFCRSTRSKVA